MDQDDLIAEACGVPRETYFCGCLRPFSMGFGYRDPLAMCPKCRAKESRARAGYCLLGLAAIIGALWLRFG